MQCARERVAPQRRRRRTAVISKTRHNDRRCVATGEALPPGALAIRFVRGPDGAAVADLSEKLPGRGAWVTGQRDLVRLAAKKGAFSRSFRDQTGTPGGPDAFADALTPLLRARGLAALGLARRSGQLHAGFEAVAKRAGDLSAYLTPEDASEDGVGKIASRVAAAGTAPHIRLPVLAEDLSAAIGEPSAVHLGTLSGKAGRSAAWACLLWAGYQGEPAGS